jgi:hypothetical protein
MSHASVAVGAAYRQIPYIQSQLALGQTLNLHEDSIIALQVAVIGVANRDDARAESEVGSAGGVGEFIAHQ